MTVAVAHSDDARAKTALRSAAKEAVWRGEPLAVLRVVPGVEKSMGEDAALTTQVGAELAEFRDLTWKVYTTPEGADTAEAILHLAEEVEAAVLVIGSRRRSAVGKLLLGSTVQRVLMEASMPVLLVKDSDS